MWKLANPNPKGKQAPDCVVRAICIALDRHWYVVHRELCLLARIEASMPSDDHVWGKYLYQLGFKPFMIPEDCPSCLTVRQFCRMYPKGRYIIGTGNHAVAVIDGDYYDSWDSGDESPSFFWRIDG